MNKKLALYFIINVLFFSCIERIDVTTPWQGVNLVIEGSITNLPGPYEVSVSKSSRYSSNPDSFEQSEKVSGADVFIRHMETDQVYSLSESVDSAGYYLTNDISFQGQINNSYRLEIETDQKIYHSTEVTILPVAPIDSIFYEYFEDINAVGVFINTLDPVNESNRYRWNWSGYYHVRTNLTWDPDTIDCCIDCYVPARGNNINIAADKYINGNPILKRLVSTIPLDSPSDYLVEIEQLSLDEEAYAFWELLDSQEQSSGGLFDAPPFKIKGNMINTENPNEEVLGLFSASGIAEAFIKVNRRQFNNVNYPFVAGDCRWAILMADTTLPPNWNEYVY